MTKNSVNDRPTARAVAQAGSSDGFTLIEILVVVLIIGVLAAIAIPSFLNQRTKGQDACAKSMVRTMQLSMETYYTSQNTYGDADVTALNGIEKSVTFNVCGAGGSTDTGTGTENASNCTGTPGTGSGIRGYCVSVTSQSGNTFAVSRNSGNGAITRTCTGAGNGGCPGSGGGNSTW
jgi:type IV pilus assembly protein PilA